MKKREVVADGEEEGPKVIRAKSFAAMHSPSGSNTNIAAGGAGVKPPGSTSNLLSPMSMLGIGKKNRYFYSVSLCKDLFIYINLFLFI